MINGEKWVYPWLFGWWFGTCLSIQLGMSSSQLTNYYFSEGQVYHQPDAMMGINSWKWDWHEAIFEQDDGNRNGIEVPFLCVGLSTPSNQFVIICYNYTRNPSVKLQLCSVYCWNPHFYAFISNTNIIEPTIQECHGQKIQWDANLIYALVN